MNIEWNNIKKIGQSKIVGMTIMVPIFGYLIFFNDFLINFFKDYMSFLQTISKNNITINDKLFYLYFGFSFLGVASILYKIFSPNLINEYISMREYIKDEKELLTNTNIRNLFNKLKNMNIKEVEILQDKIIPVDIIEKSTIIEIMKTNWDYYNNLYKFIRCTIVVFYIIGFIFISVPSMNMFYNIFLIFFKIS